MDANVIKLESYRRKIIPSAPPRPWHQIASKWVLDWADARIEISKMLSEREVSFLMNLEKWSRPISDRQKAWLHDLIDRIKQEVDRTKPQPPAA